VRPAPAQKLRGIAERAIALHRQGDPAAAIPLYKSLLAAQPNSVPMRILLAQALAALGDDAAEHLVLQKAIAIDPRSIMPRMALAARAERLGRPREALARLDEALAIDPANFEARVRRAGMLAALRRLEEAETLMAAIVAERPEIALHWVAYGSVLAERHRYAEAEAAYRQALTLAPDLPAAHHGLATVMDGTSRTDQAIATYRHAIALAPDDAIAKTNYATLLTRLGRMREAEDAFEAALALAPDLPSANNNLGSLLIKTGDVERGVALEARAAALDPDNPGFAANVLFVSHYDPAPTPPLLAEAHAAWGRRQPKPGAGAAGFANLREPERRLRIGYVSPDFRNHSVGRILAPILAAHDPAQVETVLYGEVVSPDAMTERFRSMASAWRSTVGVEDGTLIRQIRADGIDMLVDLAGHSAGNRLGVFAGRAAPVQVTWLGYPDTTGLPTMDYRLVDRMSDPEGPGDRLATETLIRLPDGFIAAPPPAGAPKVAVPPVFRKGHVTFGSFNNLAKVNRRVVALWARVLEQVPGSVLLLKSSFSADEWAHDRFRRAFAAAGIPSERLQFRARMASEADHLSVYGEVDIALDPFPYNGTITTLEGLAMGVPLVTLEGSSHVSRVGASLLTRVGHPEWIAPDEDAYVAKAAALAADRAGLAVIRVRLRDEYLASPLADPARLARAVEAAYREMWRRWCGHP
jgi:predicted O-linked N-acetylglucosamine transferase (SPINDLY family)